MHVLVKLSANLLQDRSCWIISPTNVRLERQLAHEHILPSTAQLLHELHLVWLTIDAEIQTKDQVNYKSQ